MASIIAKGNEIVVNLEQLSKMNRKWNHHQNVSLRDEVEKALNLQHLFKPKET